MSVGDSSGSSRAGFAKLFRYSDPTGVWSNGCLTQVIVAQGRDSQRVSLHRIVLIPGGEWSTAMQSDREMTGVVFSGSGIAICDEDERPLKPAETFYIPKDGFLRIIADGDSTLILYVWSSSLAMNSGSGTSVC